MVPEIERGARRAEAERQHGEPRRGRGRPHRLLEQQVAAAATACGRCRAERGDGIGRRLAEAARQHRIERPGESAAQRQRIAQRVGAGEVHAATEGQQHDAGETQQCAREMRPAQALAGERRRQQHDQQRPQIVYEIGFGGRSKLQRGEVECVVAEQAADAQQPDAHWPSDQSPPADAARERAHDADSGTDGERHGNHLERRDRTGRYRQRRQRAPQRDGGESRGHRAASVDVGNCHCRRIENAAAPVERTCRAGAGVVIHGYDKVAAETSCSFGRPTRSVIVWRAWPSS